MARTELRLMKTVQAPFSEAWVREAVSSALASAGMRKNVMVSVRMTGDAEMRRLNRIYRGKDKTTDVLAFEGAEADLGDIVISVPQARRQAKEAGKGMRKEMAMLIVHGTLHLLGYDHERPKDAKEMMPLQAKALERLGYDE